MKQEKISVIIPVYKVKESLLEKNLQSCISQKYSQVEYLVIDDGSPDNCGKICDKYGLKDSRVNVFHRKNEGVSAARNFGLSMAQGKYILFVDGDDYLEENAIENLSQNIKNDADIILFKHKRLKENEQIKKTNYLNNDINLDYKIIANVIVANDENKLGYKDVCFGSPWGKMFKKEYLEKNNIKFPYGIKKSQDRIFMLRAMSFSPMIKLIDFYGYCYIENSTSICQLYNPNIVEILENSANEFERTINNYYKDEQKEILLESYDYLQYDFLFNMFRLFFFNKSHKSSKVDFKLYLDLCREKEQYYSKCSYSGMGKKKKLVLFLLKHKMYKFLYILMGKFIKMN